MSRPSVASYLSEGTAYSAAHSTTAHTRKASTEDSTDSFANPVFFHTPPNSAAPVAATAGGTTGGMTGVSSSSNIGPSPVNHEGHVYDEPAHAAGRAPPPSSASAAMGTGAAGTHSTNELSSSGRPPRASSPRQQTLASTSANRGTSAGKAAHAPIDDGADYDRSDRADGGLAPISAESQAEAETAAFDNLEREARQALESIAMRNEDMEVHMNDYIRTLRQYRGACEARTLYREAHLVEQVLKNLKIEEETRHLRGLTEQQMQERQQLEEAHREEFRTFHRAWNAKIDEFEESQLEAEIALLERQNEDLLALHEAMRSYNPRAQKSDKHTLDVRTRQQLLASQRDYRGASKAKAEGDVLEWHQLERGEEERAATYVRRERTLRQHHIQELNALRMKVESKRLLLEKHRKRELDELLQRYINLRRGMDNQHAIVRGKTGTLLLKHAQNPRSNLSGTAAVVESAFSGAFGTTVQRRRQEEFAQSSVASTSEIRAGPHSYTLTHSSNGSGQNNLYPTPEQTSGKRDRGGMGDGVAVTSSYTQADQRRLMGGSRYP